MAAYHLVTTRSAFFRDLAHMALGTTSCSVHLMSDSSSPRSSLQFAMSGVDRNSHRSDPSVSSSRESPDASPLGAETLDSSRPLDPAASTPTEEGGRADIPGPLGLLPEPIDIPGQQPCPPQAVHVADVNPPDPREHLVAGFRSPLVQVPGGSDSSARNSPKSKQKDRHASKRDVEVFHNLSFAFLCYSASDQPPPLARSTGRHSKRSSLRRPRRRLRRSRPRLQRRLGRSRAQLTALVAKLTALVTKLTPW